jgi:hypothetical protein
VFDRYLTSVLQVDRAGQGCPVFGLCARASMCAPAPVRALACLRVRARPRVRAPIRVRARARAKGCASTCGVRAEEAEAEAEARGRDASLPPLRGKGGLLSTPYHIMPSTPYRKPDIHPRFKRFYPPPIEAPCRHQEGGARAAPRGPPSCLTSV